jgi:GAF domain-containing protein
VTHDPVGFGPALWRAADPAALAEGRQEMFDQRLFMKTLSRFSVVLTEHHDLDAAALAELTRSVTAVLGLGGNGVAMAEEGQLQFVTAVSPDSKELERSQEEHQEGPCRDAYETGEVVRVTDVRQESARWPDYSATATRPGPAGVAGIPMRDADEIIGALNIYSREPREWSDQDIAVAVVLADVATSYVLNAAKLHDQEQLSEQLQQALDSRVVIEQAKGVTAQRKSVTVDHAYQLMRGHARNNHASLRTVAEAIVDVGLQL